MLVGIITSGTYFCPWFPYGLASFYFCDKIVVTNGGFDLKNPDPKEFNVPLEEITRAISELDIHGKVVEWRDWSLRDLQHKMMLSTEKGHPQGITWADMRGVGLTLAIEKAQALGATWILKWDSDQVGYEDCRELKNNLRSVTFHQHEFVGTEFKLADPPPDSPYNDSIFSFKAHPDNFFGGGGVPALSSVLRDPRHATDDYHCAHLRYANPSELSVEKQFKHFYGRAWFSKHTNEGLWGEELYNKATSTAEDLMNKKGKGTVAPPEACLLSASKLKEYIEETYHG